MDKERAVEILAHQIAGGVHLMLAHARMTVVELSAVLDGMQMKDGGSELLDDLLAARNPHLMKLSFLSDVAFALDGEWSFEIRKMAEPVALPEAT